MSRVKVRHMATHSVTGSEVDANLRHLMSVCSWWTSTVCFPHLRSPVRYERPPLCGGHSTRGYPQDMCYCMCFNGFREGVTAWQQNLCSCKLSRGTCHARKVSFCANVGCQEWRFSLPINDVFLTPLQSFRLLPKQHRLCEVF